MRAVVVRVSFVSPFHKSAIKLVLKLIVCLVSVLFAHPLRMVQVNHISAVQIASVFLCAMSLVLKYNACLNKDLVAGGLNLSQEKLNPAALLASAYPIPIAILSLAKEHH